MPCTYVFYMHHPEFSIHVQGAQATTYKEPAGTSTRQTALFWYGLPLLPVLVPHATLFS